MVSSPPRCGDLCSWTSGGRGGIVQGEESFRELTNVIAAQAAHTVQWRKSCVPHGVMGNQDLLERSFILADSGRMKDIRDIRFALIREGFSYAELGQLGGKALSRQIIAKIASARLRLRAAEK